MERKHHGLKKWQDHRAPVRSSQTIATIVDDEDSDLESTSDTSYTDSDQSSDYESDEAPMPQVVHIVENSRGQVGIHKSSLRIPSKTRPRIRKKVSMGSVEVLDDEGAKIVAKQVDFNDTGSQRTNQHDALKEEKIDPKEKYNSSMKNMSDVMNYLENARKPSTNLNNVPVASTTSTPVKKPVFKRQQTPLPKKEIEMFSFDDDNDIVPPKPLKLSERKRSSSFSVPAKQNDGGSFFSKWSRPRSSSYSKYNNYFSVDGFLFSMIHPLFC